MLLESTPRKISQFPGTATRLRGDNCSAYIIGGSQIVDAMRQAMPGLDASFDRNSKAFFESIPQIWGSSYAIAIVNDAGTFCSLIADPLGGFPIYFTETAWSFDLANILPNLNKKGIDELALQEYFRHGWLMDERTLLSEVSQVQPSHCVQIRAGQPPTSHRYARIDFIPSREFSAIDVAISRTNQHLDDYFDDLRMRSESIGILFSGGVDSALLLAKAKSHNFKKIVAISAYFPGHTNPESERAEAVARHLGVEIRLSHVSAPNVANSIGPAIRNLERPLSYANSLARWKMFQDVSSDVGIVLSGEGADCLFGSDDLLGVRRYENKQRILNLLPGNVRNLLANCIEVVPYERVRRRASEMRVNSIDRMRQSSELGSPAILIKNYESRSLYAEFEPVHCDSMMAVAQNRTLYTSNRNQLVTYNRLALPFGLSVEFPFLERNMVNVGLTLSDTIKHDRRGAKPVLKRLTCRYVPEDLVYAPKFDFRPPLGEWLGGPLAPFAKILSEERTLSRGIFDQDVIRRLSISSDASTIFEASCLEIFFRHFVDEST